MSITRVKASSITQGLPKGKTALTGNSVILPGSYESIATVDVGVGGAALITFADIPTGYKHLQVRCFAQTDRATYAIDEGILRLNSDTGSNYSYHRVNGTGAAAEAAAATSASSIVMGARWFGATPGSNFGVTIVDILEYANANIYKTVRMLGGSDCNGIIAGFGGSVGLASGSWRSTSAVTTINIAPSNGTLFNQYSSFALYGIK